MTDFKELREALEAGPTDGPWVADRWTSNEGGCYGWSFSAGGYLLPLSDMETDNPDECDANAALIAAANPATIRSLLKELDEARRDAERYRKLKASGKYCAASIGGGWGLSCGNGTRASDEALDSAIDAMKEQQP